MASRMVLKVNTEDSPHVAARFGVQSHTEFRRAA